MPFVSRTRRLFPSFETVALPSMFRFTVSEKALVFVPALLLTSQIFYRIFSLQTAGYPEVAAFAVIPAAFAALAIGIFLRRKNWSRPDRFLLHTGLFALLTCSTLIPPTLLNGAELIILCIFAGMVFAGIPENKGGMIPVLLGVIAAGLLFSPSRQSLRGEPGSCPLYFRVFRQRPCRQRCKG